MYNAILFFLILLVSCSSSSEESNLENSSQENHQKKTRSVQSKENCTPVVLYTNNGNKLKLHKNLQEIQQQSLIFSLSPNNQYLLYEQSNTIYIHDLLMKKSVKLHSLHEEVNSISDIKWNTQSSYFVFLEKRNQEAYFEVFSWKNKKLVWQKEIMTLDADYEQNIDCPQKLELNFQFEGDSCISYQSLDSLYDYKYVYLQDFPKEKNIIIRGTRVNAAIYEIVNHKGKPVDLSLSQKKNIAQSYLFPSFGISQNYILYGVQNASLNCIIKVYRFDQEVEELLSLPQNSRGISNILWTPDKKKCAFVDVNTREEYPFDTRIYVLWLSEKGELEHKQIFDSQVNYHCGTSCYVQAGKDFWFEDNHTLKYKKNTPNPEDMKEVEIETIMLKQ